MIEIPVGAFVAMSAASMILLFVVIGFIIDHFKNSNSSGKVSVESQVYTGIEHHKRLAYYRQLPKRIDEYKIYINDLEDSEEKDEWLKHVESLKQEHLKYLAREDEDILGKAKVKD